MLIDGLGVGHVSLGDTGVTALVATDPAGMVAAVDVRGGGPGTRETDLLEPHNTVERVNAVLLCGGSAFGLAAAEGAMAELERRGVGFKVFGDSVPDGPVVPIVPAAVIFDLAVGDPRHRPEPADGAAAVRAALEDTGGGARSEGDTDPLSGSVGAGCGATAGVLRGGFGQAHTHIGQFTVAACVVANPVGSVVDPVTGLLYGDPTYPAVDVDAFRGLSRPVPGHTKSKLNTTIGVIATDAPLSKAQLKRLAMSGHDGIARAVRPAHSPLDGDTLFAVSVAGAAARSAAGRSAAGSDAATVEKLTALNAAAADCVQAAIVDAVVRAQPGYGLRAWSEIAR